jgi:hypothetical protein
VDFSPFGGQADSHRTAVDSRSGMMQKASFDELLNIVRDVRAEVIAAGAQFACSEFLIANIVEEQGLHGIDVAAASTVEFVLNHVEQASVQALDKCQGLEIGGPNLRESASARLLRGLTFPRIHHRINLVLRIAAAFKPARSYDQNTRYK